MWAAFLNRLQALRPQGVSRLRSRDYLHGASRAGSSWPGTATDAALILAASGATADGNCCSSVRAVLSVDRAPKWRTLRRSDHKGVAPKDINISGSFLVANLKRSKTVGADNVTVKPMGLDTCFLIETSTWLQTGWSASSVIRPRLCSRAAQMRRWPRVTEWSYLSSARWRGAHPEHADDPVLDATPKKHLPAECCIRAGNTEGAAGFLRWLGRPRNQARR